MLNATDANKPFIASVEDGFDPEQNEDVFATLFNQYEQVIVRSIITSFGLDIFIQDQYGGDVDTIHNVRQIDSNSNMRYKNIVHEKEYKNRGEYVYHKYHSDERFRKIKHDARSEYMETGRPIKDEYTGETNLHFFGSKNLSLKIKKAELDHVKSTKGIHDDRGRILSGLDGIKLANSPENLKFTNKNLNASKNATEIPNYVAKKQDLDSGTKVNMQEHYKNAKKAIDTKINRAYYTSSAFFKDSGIAALKLGRQMALRQAIGFVFAEVWFSVKDKLLAAGKNFDDKIKAIIDGVEQGFINAKNNLKELLSKFGEGAIAGIISSLTTTLCNIFLTTHKNLVRVIRQTWASIVEATKILIFNPDKFSFGERMRAALKILAAGASVVIGTVVQDAVRKALTPHLVAVPVLGGELLDIISVFSSSLCTGFLTITLLFIIDNDPFNGYLMKQFDKTIAEYERQAKLFEIYAAELEKIDIETLRRETELYHNLAIRLEMAKDASELNNMLHGAIKLIGVSIPWGDCSLDEFMNNKSMVLRIG